MLLWLFNKNNIPIRRRFSFVPHWNILVSVPVGFAKGGLVLAVLFALYCHRFRHGLLRLLDCLCRIHIQFSKDSFPKYNSNHSSNVI